eukprot:12884105-Prorocentrum_lima.AAC.1
MGWGCPLRAGPCCHAAICGGGDSVRPLAAGTLRKVVGYLELTTPTRRGPGGKSPAGAEGCLPTIASHHRLP